MEVKSSSLEKFSIAYIESIFTKELCEQIITQQYNIFKNNQTSTAGYCSRKEERDAKRN